MTVCIVDTSILAELLNLPGMAEEHEETVASFEARQKEREQFLLPLAALIETGNHVAHLTDGAARRKFAQIFVTFAKAALGGATPFVATPFPSANDVASWLDGFPDQAMKKVGLADRSMIALWEEQVELHPMRRIYIWSLDSDLRARDTGARV